MPLVTVDSFQAFWNIKNNMGRMCVWKEGCDKTYDFDVDSAEEFQMLVNILKNETNIGYDPECESISIGHIFDDVEEDEAAPEAETTEE